MNASAYDDGSHRKAGKPRAEEERESPGPNTHSALDTPQLILAKT